tara:strand:+ start:915 stop:3269 length:2355 start_codon:yes stop_codon:yes gene_type:complete
MTKKRSTKTPTNKKKSNVSKNKSIIESEKELDELRAISSERLQLAKKARKNMEGLLSYSSKKEKPISNTARRIESELSELIAAEKYKENRKKNLSERGKIIKKLGIKNKNRDKERAYGSSLIYQSRMRRRENLIKLTSFGFENFKIFKNKNIFDIANCNALLGGNGVGKSTVFEVIKLLTQSRDIEADDRLDTYQGMYKEWNNPLDLVFKKIKNSEILFEFQTSVETKIHTNESRRAQEDDSIDIDTNDIHHIILKAVQKEVLEDGWSADQAILNGGLPELISQIVDRKSDDHVPNFFIEYKVQISFDIPKINSKKDINYLSVSGMKILDKKTDQIISEFHKRVDAKSKNKKFDFIGIMQKYFLDKKNSISIKNLENFSSHFENVKKSNDLIQKSLMSDKGHIRFWEILRLLILDYCKISNDDEISINVRRTLLHSQVQDTLWNQLIEYSPEELRDFAHAVFPLYQVKILESGVFRLSSSLLPFYNLTNTTNKKWIETSDSEWSLDPGLIEKIYRAGSINNLILNKISKFYNKLNLRNEPLRRGDDIMAPYRYAMHPINQFLFNSRFIESVQPQLVSFFKPRLGTKIDIDHEEQKWETNTVIDLLYRDKDVLKSLNKWLPKIGLNYKLSAESNHLASGGTPLIRVMVQDVLLKVSSIDLQDIGYGAFQAIRLVVILLSYRNKNIFLTEPEQNLHPSVHIKFVDLIYESINKNKNKVFIETHSENIILKLLQMIQKNKFTPQDVNISVVTRGSDGGKVNRILIDENGDTVSEWPNGFFADRYDLL